MTHEQCRDSLGAWLDGELTPQAASVVAEHVGSCAPCRAAAEEIRALTASLRALPRHELPDDLKARLLRQPDVRSARAPWRSPWALASFASAAVAALVVIGVIGLRPPDAPRLARLEAPEAAEAPEAREALDANEEKDLGNINGTFEQGPAQGQEPAAAPPARQNAGRFAPVPPAAPEDLPPSRDDDAAASGLAAEEARDAETELQAGRSSATTSSEAPPPVALQKSSPAATTRERAGKLEAAPLTYIARLVVDHAGAYRLEPVEPPPAGDKKDAGAAEGSMARMSADAATPESSAEAPAAAKAKEHARASAAAADAGAAVAPAQLMFLVQLDAEGIITSAQLVGARTTAPEVADAARSLLIGSRFPGEAMGRFSHATVQVLVPDPRPAR